jgi:hypothetical protein
MADLVCGFQPDGASFEDCGRRNHGCARTYEPGPDTARDEGLRGGRWLGSVLACHRVNQCGDYWARRRSSLT